MKIDISSAISQMIMLTGSIKRDWSGMVVVYRRPQTLQPTFAVD